MPKDIILEQKKAKENFKAKNYIIREKLNEVKKLLKTSLVKVITGPRRAGKSVFSMQLLEGLDYAYVNFDDDNLLKVKDTNEIVNAIFQAYKNPKYLLFDEIQNLENWELFVNKLHRQGYNIIVTGSNAKLLSKELASALTGRHIPVEIFPFSFTEYMKAQNLTLSKDDLTLPRERGELQNLLMTYIQSGGYPEVIVSNLDPKTYIDPLFDSIILKDVVKRYKIRLSQGIYDLATYLVNNFASEFSFTKLKNVLSIGSVHTLQNYLGYLEETFLFFSLNRFNFKLKEQIKAPKKIYIIDNGIIQAKAFQSSQNMGKLMENAFFVEMLKFGYKPNQNIFYYKTRNQKEVDFVIKEGIKIKTLIQITYEINPEIEKREIKALVEASEELKCKELVVINWDIEKTKKLDGLKIKFIPFWKWLLNPSFN